jgi:uncharacterized membrane protein
MLDRAIQCNLCLFALIALARTCPAERTSHLPAYRIVVVSEITAKKRDEPDLSMTPLSVADGGLCAGSSGGGWLPGPPWLYVNAPAPKLIVLDTRTGSARAIGPAGDVVGFIGYGDGPVIWRKSAGYHMEILSDLRGGALCMSANGIVGGYVVSGGHNRAVTWKEGAMSYLDSADFPDTVCEGINSTGLAVGYRGHKLRGDAIIGEENAPNTHAVMWREGRLIDLPNSADVQSECVAVNDSGVAIGWTAIKSRVPSQACRWHDNRLELLSTPAGLFSYAYGLNRRGDIVGTLKSPELKVMPRACLWRGQDLIDLNQTIRRHSGWRLEFARAISDDGTIAVEATRLRDNTFHALLLVPVTRR